MSNRPPSRVRRRRSLNVTFIKSAVVFIVSLATSILSILTGIGPHATFTPLLTWMLGFGTEKATGTATAFAVAAAAVASLTALALHTAPVFDLMRAAVLVVAATVGALVALPGTPKPDQVAWRRLGQTIGVMVCVYVIADSSHRGIFNAHHVEPVGLLILLLIGLISGAATQLLTLPGGMLMVAGLYFIGQFSAQEAVVLSLMVVALASAMPASVYARRGLVDSTYGAKAVSGGIVGGGLGGLLLYRASDRVILSLFAAAAMFLCARELARLYFQASGPRTPQTGSG